MTAMAELAHFEIDDAFLTGERSSNQNSCDVCGRSSSSARSRRKSPPGLAVLFATAGPANRTFLLVVIVVFFVLLLLLLALLFAFAYPFSRHASCVDLPAATPPTTSDAESRERPLLATNGEPFPWQDVRLPRFVEPVHYDLFMHPNLTSFFNKGSVEIVLNVHQRSNFLLLHAKELNISGISLQGSTGAAPVAVQRFLLCADHEQLYIEFDGYLEPTSTNYSLKISFSKLLEEKLEGKRLWPPRALRTF